MIKLYFISVLVVTTNTIPEGWLQWTIPYSDKSVCEELIKKDKEEIVLAVSKYFGSKRFVMAKDFECMTYDEAVKLNTELGH